MTKFDIVIESSTIGSEIIKRDFTSVRKGNHLPITTAILGAILLLSGCDSAKESAYEERAVTEEAADYASDESAAADAAIIIPESTGNDPAMQKTTNDKLSVENLSGDSEQTLGSQGADIEIAGKKLLITADATFKVKDVIETSNAIENMTRLQGGYVAKSHIANYENDSRTFVQKDKNITLTTYSRQADMTLRIPKVNVNKFLKQVQQQIAFLDQHSFSAQDVTLDIYREQLAGQLNRDMASELSEERLRSKNDKDQGSNIEAISATYDARRQQELAKLEQMEIEDRVKYSTINLTFNQPDISYKQITPNLEVVLDAQRPSFSTQVNQAFKEGWETLRVVAITLIKLWWLVVLFAVFYLIYRLIKALYRKIFGHKAIMSAAKRKEWFGEDEKTIADTSTTKKIIDDKDNRLS